VLERESYFYAWGYTAQVAATIALGHARLEGTLLRGGYHSIDGLDRAQERITYDVPLAEAIWEYGASLWLSDRFLSWGVVYEERRRNSDAAGVAVQTSGRRLLLKTGLSL
jgi:hypothetical protein